MKKIFTIALWEFITKVRTKTFLISAILMPAIIFLFGYLPLILAEKVDTTTKKFGVVDLTGWVYPEFEKKLTTEFKFPDGRPNYILTKIGTETSDIALIKAEANRKVVEKIIDAYIIIPRNFEDSLKFDYIGLNVGNIKDIERIKSTLQRIAIEKKISTYGIAPEKVEELTKPVKYATIRITKKGKEEKAGFEQIFFSSYIFIIALMILVLTGGQMLVRSVVEEKSNRIVEILLSSCTSNQLMAGKIIGLGLVGLTQIFIWGIFAFYFFAGMTMVSISLKFDILAISLIYFLLGYLFYSAVFVAVGAPLNTEYEAQQIAGYVSLALMFPFVFAFLIMQNPETPLIKFLTFIPFFTPSLMVVRLPIKMPTTWEIISSISLLSLFIVLMIWIAGRIFRIAILSYGKFPSFKELLLWIKSK